MSAGKKLLIMKSEPGAKAAELVFMVGGEKGPISRVLPLLQIMGKQVFVLGRLGAGHAMKCINNLITAITFMATAEGLTIGKQFGVDPDVMTDVLNASTGMSWISQTHIRQRITSRKFDDAFKLELMVKDIGIAMQLASTLGFRFRCVPWVSSSGRQPDTTRRKAPALVIWYTGLST